MSLGREREPGALPPVIDAEHMGPCLSGQIANVVEELTTLLNMLESHYGRRPLVYTTSEFDAAYLHGQLPNERFRVRSLFLPPTFRAGQWLIWQFHNGASALASTDPSTSMPFVGPGVISRPS